MMTVVPSFQASMRLFYSLWSRCDKTILLNRLQRMFKEKWKKNVPALAKAIAQNLPTPSLSPVFSTLETIVFRGPYNGRSSGTDLRLPRHKGEASRTVNKVVPVSFHGFRQKGEIQPFFVAGLRFEDFVSRGPPSSKQVKCRIGRESMRRPAFIYRLGRNIQRIWRFRDPASSRVFRFSVPCTFRIKRVYLFDCCLVELNGRIFVSTFELFLDGI